MEFVALWPFGSARKRDSSRGWVLVIVGPGVAPLPGVPRLSEAVAQPTRLETRTKESGGRASRRVFETRRRSESVGPIPLPSRGWAQGRPR